MGTILELPHRVKAGMCPVNGIRDLVQWRTGRDWSNELVWGLAQGGGFAYLRFDRADPPRQIYTGNSTARQHKYLAKLLRADLVEVENRAFAFSWQKARQAVDAGTPPVLGPLDMYYLHYFQGLYHARHIPIHYVLLVGYDDQNAFILDTGEDAVQAIPLEELRQAWDVNVPGLGKHNRLAVLNIPRELPPTAQLIREALADNCQAMLHPPVSLAGIPAMRKAAREIPRWPAELGAETADRCLRQAREYLNSPPDLEGNHLTAGRDLIITAFTEAGELAGLRIAAVVEGLRRSMEIVPRLAAALRQGELTAASSCLAQMADAEEAAYMALQKSLAQ